MIPAMQQTQAETKNQVADRYKAGIARFLSGGGEEALQEAYEIGRSAVAQGIGVLEMALLHHSALEENLPPTLSQEERARRLTAAAEFFVESLAPHEMAYRGHREAGVVLRHFNELLEQQARRIAHAIHDEAGQLLVALHLDLADFARNLPPEVRSRLTSVTGLLQKVEEELRCLSHELRPTVLDDLGLVPALEFLADKFTKRAGVQVELNTSLTGRLPSSLETAIYRIVQEVLNNIRKHAHARNARIELRRQNDVLHGSIQDDGVGFDVDAVMGKQGQRGLGLLGIGERLNAIGGTFEIDSEIGRGTVLRITVPLGRLQER